MPSDGGSIPPTSTNDRSRWDHRRPEIRGGMRFPAFFVSVEVRGSPLQTMRSWGDQGVHRGRAAPCTPRHAPDRHPRPIRQEAPYAVRRRRPRSWSSIPMARNTAVGSTGSPGRRSCWPRRLWSPACPSLGTRRRAIAAATTGRRHCASWKMWRRRWRELPCPRPLTALAAFSSAVAQNCCGMLSFALGADICSSCP